MRAESGLMLHTLQDRPLPAVSIRSLLLQFSILRSQTVSLTSWRLGKPARDGTGLNGHI